MDTTWTLGVLPAGVENVQPLAGGTEESVAAAREAAGDALVLAALGRGRQHYRLRLVGTDMMVVPGLTADGHIDVDDLYEAVWSLWETPNPDRPRPR